MPWMLQYLSFSNTAYQRIAHSKRSTIQLLQCKTSSLPEPWPQQPRDELSDFSARFMESHGVMNMSSKSAILKESSSNWLNSGKPLTRHLKGAIFAFPCFSRWSRDMRWMRWGKQFHPIACSLYNISAKSYQNRLMHFEVIVCNITVVFETQCIFLGTELIVFVRMKMMEQCEQRLM